MPISNTLHSCYRFFMCFSAIPWLHSPDTMIVSASKVLIFVEGAAGIGGSNSDAVCVKIYATDAAGSPNFPYGILQSFMCLGFSPEAIHFLPSWLPPTKHLWGIVTLMKPDICKHGVCNPGLPKSWLIQLWTSTFDMSSHWQSIFQLIQLHSVLEKFS